MSFWAFAVNRLHVAGGAEVQVCLIRVSLSFYPIRLCLAGKHSLSTSRPICRYSMIGYHNTFLVNLFPPVRQTTDTVTVYIPIRVAPLSDFAATLSAQ